MVDNHLCLNFQDSGLDLYLWNFHELSLQSQVRQDQTHEFQDHG